MKAILAALLIVIGLPSPARAWGAEGHRIAAEIAEQFLEPATAHQVRELLAIENKTTVGAGTRAAMDGRTDCEKSNQLAACATLSGNASASCEWSTICLKARSGETQREQEA